MTTRERVAQLQERTADKRAKRRGVSGATVIVESKPTAGKSRGPVVLKDTRVPQAHAVFDACGRQLKVCETLKCSFCIRHGFPLPSY